MEKFLEKRLTVRTFLNVILFLMISSGIMFLVMRYNTKKIERNFAEYKIKAEQKEQQLSYIIDSLDKKYNDLYNNLDNLYTLNWDNVDFWADYYGVKNKEAIMSQIAIESAYLTSNICLKYNNLVGMHYPVIRKTTATGYIRADRRSKVAVYDHWRKSIQDYKYWQDYFGHDEELHIDEYLAKLDDHGSKGYAEANGYTDAVKSVYLKKFMNFVPLVKLH